jgi:hypothetical protein
VHPKETGRPERAGCLVTGHGAGCLVRLDLTVRSHATLISSVRPGPASSGVFPTKRSASARPRVHSRLEPRLALGFPTCLVDPVRLRGRSSAH